MKHWLAIDVSKLTLAVVLQIEGRKRADEREFNNDAAGHARLAQWASERGAPLAQLTGVMEATGVYHEALAQWLHDRGCRVIVANPARVRDYARGIGLLHKSDKVDARALLRYGQQQADALVAWTPPPPEIRTLRALYARLAAVQEDLQREENRRRQAQTSAQPTLVIDSLNSSVAHLQQECQRLQQAIEDHFDQYPPLKAQRKLLQSIPSVGPVSGDMLLCLLLSHRFTQAREAAAFCGLIPRTCQSGTSVHRRGKLSKQGDARLRAKLYMPAVVALKHNRQLRAIYDGLLKAGKPKLSALCALMRRLVHIAFGILKHQTPYNPDLVGKVA